VTASKLLWSPSEDRSDVLATVYHAHRVAVDDWIPFERYVSKPTSRNEFNIEGPESMIRAHAKALRRDGKQPRIVLRAATRKPSGPRVLYFGESFVVADAFTMFR